MKGRSYRFSSTELHEDWVDGSWTVDCVCGVNFDDGEEMVNCDECGVWVHTRCSRYVKGDELFTCDKCKSKNSINDSEETEVAQLLVELPTKTLRMENSYPQSIPLRRPFRLWTEIPMEERVHVQGVPGGDPALFEGLSSVFSRELWKSTGYVPKKFSIKYREFPCWGEKEKNERENPCENGHQAENGAGVLFSMSKENVLAAPTSALVGTRGLDDKEANLKLSVKDNKRWNSSEVDPKRSETGLKKEKSLLRPVITNKRKKEELGASRDRIKKKVQVTDREADEKKGLVRKAASRSTGDSKPLDSRKDRDSHALNGDIGNVKSERSKETNEESFDSGLAVNNGSDVTSNVAIPVECSKVVLHSDGRAHGTRNQDDKAGHHVRIVLKSSANIDSPFQETKDALNNQAKEERHSTTADNSEDNAEVSIGISVKPSTGRADGAALEVEEKRFDDINGDISISTGKNELLKQLDDASTGGAVGQQVLEHVESKVAGTCAAGTSNIKIMALSNSHADDHKMQSFDRASDRASTDNVDKSDELASHPSQFKRELLPSEGSVSTQKDTTESKPEPGLLQEPSKKSSRPFPAYSKPKVVVCIGKSSTSEAAMPKSYSFDNLKHTASQNSIPDSKQEPNDGHANGASSDLVKEKDRDDVSRKVLKEHPKYSTSSRLIQQGRISHSSLSKRSMPESASASLSSKASSAPPTTDSAETAGSLQNQYALQLQNKQSSSGIPQKSEKHIQPICQSSTKSPGSLAPNPSATLSDEELALLLHQELNSSPRVPRVPRMRQPGSLPQLASPAATSLLIKRTSSSGSKDHVSASRKKNKDASKDGFRSSRDVDDNRGTKSYKVRYSPDWKSHDSGNKGSTCAKVEENEPAKTLHSSRKVLPPSSTTSTSSGPCSSNEVNDPSIPSPHSSPRNTSDDAPVHQTLPGLINEIMSKGKRMTYEELCNAVLPHWPHLRKHNGERYAYSSHSQAVLDCLRNRHEWARLVDRGPKTNSTRKKRKADAEESDENESSKGRDRDECGRQQREDFPKGKRKARKRRRLALQGKDIKDLRKKRKEEMSEEDEEGPFSDSDSDSSNASMSSEDDEGEEEASLSSASEEETATATSS